MTQQQCKPEAEALAQPGFALPCRGSHPVWAPPSGSGSVESAHCLTSRIHGVVAVRTCGPLGDSQAQGIGSQSDRKTSTIWPASMSLEREGGEACVQSIWPGARLARDISHDRMMPLAGLLHLAATTSAACGPASSSNVTSILDPSPATINGTLPVNPSVSFLLLTNPHADSAFTVTSLNCTESVLPIARLTGVS